MTEEKMTTTVYVLYAPGHGFLYGNRLETSKDFSSARFFSKNHFAKNSLKMQAKSHKHRIRMITVDGNIDDIKVLPVTVSVESVDVFMTELGGTV